MVTTIYEDDALRVFYHDRASADVIVTANNFGTINGESYWGRKAIEPLGLSCLGFVAKSPNWFPAHSTARALGACRGILARHEKKIGFGSSMGAYFLLKYGAALTIDLALCFSPQFSIDPGRVGRFDNRFRAHFLPALHADHVIRSEDLPRRAMIVYDPYFEMDVGHVRLLQGLGGQGMELVPLPNIEHGTIHVAVGGENFRALYAIASTLAATAGRDLHRLLLRRKRETLHWHQRIVHRALRSRRTGLAGGLVARAIIRWPKDFHLNLAYLDWCIASGTASGADARLRDIEALGFGADPRGAARRRSLAAT